MKKRTKTIVITLVIITLTLIYTLASTYSVIINVTNKNGINEIVNQINIRDLFTNDDGSYNNTYYEVRNELNITDEEANILMNSTSLNTHLQTVLNSIVEVKLNDNIGAKLTNDQLYNLIVDGLNNTENINEELKNKVINKSNQYKQDIQDFVYDIEVSLLGG